METRKRGLRCRHDYLSHVSLDLDGTQAIVAVRRS
jgi:hypothetical protein